MSDYEVKYKALGFGRLPNRGEGYGYEGQAKIESQVNRITKPTLYVFTVSLAILLDPTINRQRPHATGIPSYCCDGLLERSHGNILRYFYSLLLFIITALGYQPYIPTCICF